MYASSASRKTLQVLQPVANNQRRLVGGNGVIRLDKQTEAVAVESRKARTAEKQDLTIENSDPNQFKAKTQRDNSKPRVKSANPKASERADKATDTVGLEHEDVKASDGLDSISSRELLQWMTKSEPPENYWRALAEQRRIALDETLKENEELYERIDTLIKENESLKETNEALQEMAAQGERLAEIVQELTNATDD